MSILKDENMNYVDRREIRALNDKWNIYTKKNRLKNALILPRHALNFINNLKFISCEDNSDQLIGLSSGYSYEAGIKIFEQIPVYKFVVEIDRKTYEIHKFACKNQWFIENKSIEDFFNIDEAMAKTLCGMLDSFEIFEKIKNIRKENKLILLKKRYKGKSLIVKDIVSEYNNYYLILEDGMEAKLNYVPEKLI